MAFGANIEYMHVLISLNFINLIYTVEKNKLLSNTYHSCSGFVSEITGTFFETLFTYTF